MTGEQLGAPVSEREWIQFQEHQLTDRVRGLRDYLALIPDASLRWDISERLGRCFEIIGRLDAGGLEPQPDGSLRQPYTKGDAT